jgi:FixJ family two-component response regulator
MPRIYGKEIIKKLRQTASKLKVILISGAKVATEKIKKGKDIIEEKIKRTTRVITEKKS